MQKIDSHQHFWKYQPVKHSWIDESMSVIRKNFLPDSLQPILNQNNIDGCVAVQADQTEDETEFLLSLADNNPFIRGVVSWVNLRAENVKERLSYYKQFNVIKGFRHVLQNETPEFMLQPDFIAGIAALKEFDFTYDLLLFPKHLTAAIKIAKQFPDQKFVVDHLAKPYIKAALIEDWKKDITAIAQCENVFCKISGLVTEAHHANWKQQDFIPYLDTAVQAFGLKRLMFGSDWPVCLVAASYPQVIAIVEQYFASFSITEQQDIFGNNASKFYQL